MRKKTILEKEKEKLLITTDNITISGFKTINSVMGVNWEKVKGIIFNSCIDEDLSVLFEIVPFKKKLEFIIYINPDIKPILYAFFSGLGADIYTNDDLFSDDVIEFLVDNYGNSSMSLKPSHHDIKKLERCLSSVLEDDDTGAIHNRLWRKSVSEALATVDKSFARADQANTDMVEIIEKAKERVDKLAEANAEMSEQLGEVSMQIAKYNEGVSTSPIIYTAYKIPQATKRVMYIKFYSPCTYLVSYMIAFQKYLKAKKSLNSRMLLILPNLTIHAERYRDIPRLALETLPMMMTLNEPIYCTYEPKRDVLKRFFEGNNLLYIILDQAYSTNLVQGARLEKFNAVSGVSDIQRFNLDAKRTFMPITGVENSLIIPYFDGYAQNTNVTARVSMYSNACSAGFEKIIKILGV